MFLEEAAKDSAKACAIFVGHVAGLDRRSQGGAQGKPRETLEKPRKIPGNLISKFAKLVYNFE